MTAGAPIERVAEILVRAGYRQIASPLRVAGLAAVATGGLRRSPLHGGQADEEHGYSRPSPLGSNQWCLNGSVRGKPHKTTIPGKKLPCPLDKVNRQFRVPAPNMLWVSDFTYVATWKGFVYVAPRHGHSDQWRSHGSIIDAYARRIVVLRDLHANPFRVTAWRVSITPHAGFVLDALEQAVHERRPNKGMGLAHHSDRGSQYLSIKYTERLAEAGIDPSVGSVGDSYDNALAETINGLFKAELIHRRGPWRSYEAVEYATLEWVDWFNNRRLLEPIGSIPPAEAEANFYAGLETEAMAA